ncbi:hypothetical protein [Kribbella caucasensis]|uniref:hypothetical protein n=1 Tax=Kribbella caucasensis TaxID=2512215 RepID=UPI001061A315|nr:hypothetical protein [Kribbella sp. VKM Ac-2527]
MSGTERHDAEPPLLLFDDDDWLDVYDSVSRMLDHLEYPAIDEVVFVADANGRAVHLSVAGEEVVIEGVAASPQLNELRERVETFFDRWTDGAPPKRSDDPREYVQSVVSRYSAVPMRSKKRK